MRRTALLGLALLGALFFPACGEDTGTLPNVGRAALVISVTPNPVPPTFNNLTGVVSIGYTVTLTETQGLGGEMQFVAAQVFDPETGLLHGLTYFDGPDLIVFVGSKRVEPGGTLQVPQTMSYALPDGRTNALLAITAQMKDDRENLINQSLLVKVE
jgi:hypothetical protein